MNKTLSTFSPLVALFVCATAAGWTETVKLTIPLQLAGPSAKRLIRDAEKEIRERTHGRVEARFIAGQAKASDLKDINLRADQQKRLGLAQALYLLPGLIQSAEQAKALRPFMMTDLQGQLQGSGLTLLGIEQGAAAHLMSTVPITSPADLEGRKMWVPSFNARGAGMTNLLTELGVDTVDCPPKQVPDALRSGEVDLLLVPLATAIALRWHHEITYVSVAPFMYLSRPVVVKAEELTDVSDEDLKVVKQVVGRLLESLRADAERMEARSVRVLELQKIELTTPSDKDETAWNEWFRRVSNQLVEKGFIDRTRYEKVKEALAKAR